MANSKQETKADIINNNKTVTISLAGQHVFGLKYLTECDKDLFQMHYQGQSRHQSRQILLLEMCWQHTSNKFSNKVQSTSCACIRGLCSVFFLHFCIQNNLDKSFIEYFMRYCSKSFAKIDLNSVQVSFLHVVFLSRKAMKLVHCAFFLKNAVIFILICTQSNHILFTEAADVAT